MFTMIGLCIDFSEAKIADYNQNEYQINLENNEFHAGDKSLNHNQH